MFVSRAGLGLLPLRTRSLYLLDLLHLFLLRSHDLLDLLHTRLRGLDLLELLHLLLLGSHHLLQLLCALLRGVALLELLQVLLRGLTLLELLQALLGRPLAQRGHSRPGFPLRFVGVRGRNKERAADAGPVPIADRAWLAEQGQHCEKG